MYVEKTIGGRSNVPTSDFILDDVSDLVKIDKTKTTMGSTAYLITGEKKLFILNSKKEWVEQ